MGTGIDRLDRLERDERNPGPYSWRLDGKPSDEFSRQHGRMTYFAAASMVRNGIESSPGYGTLRAYCLRRWAEEPGAAVCRRVLGELLAPPHNMNLDEAERLTAAEVVERLGAIASPPADAGRNNLEEFGDAGVLIALAREIWQAVANHVPRVRECDVHGLNNRMPEAFLRAMRVVPFGTPAYAEWERRVELVRSACGDLFRLGPPFRDRTPLLDALASALGRLEQAAVAQCAAIGANRRVGAEGSGNESTGNGVLGVSALDSAGPSGSEGEEIERPRPNDNPDGPFDPDGLRSAGVEVRFAKATKQYRLVTALWDGDRKRLAMPRPVEDVIQEVWGEDNETSGSAFRQLCADARKRLQAANCPLDIQQLNGKVHLVPV